MAVGFFLTKRGVFSAAARAEVTNIVIYVVLPCNIFSSFHKGFTRAELLACAAVLAVGCAMQVLYIVVNAFAYRRISAPRRTVMKYATICNNSGFMGMPIMEAVYGAEGMLFGAIVLIPIRVAMWTAGLSLFTATDLRTKVKTLATHPCIWAVIFGFGYSFAPFELPRFASGAISALGGCTTALSMLVVGSILSTVPVKSVRDILDRDTLYYSALRLVAIPVFVLGALKLLGVDATVTGVATLSAAMPAATTTAMLASKYGADAQFSARLIMVSTVLSLVTLPVISSFCVI
jgi:predicted permease